MIIKNLRLHNFGVYAGDNEFVFHGEKPIVLIGGLNGRGKTTFLEAILLALYGSNSFAYIESEYKVYTQYLRSYVNRDAIDNMCWVELEFDIYSGENTESYRLLREWEGFSKRINESLTVYKDGEYNDFLTNNWALFVENILPSALSNLFIFDGEKIAELAVDNTNEQMKKAIRSMLGISVLDVLKNDVIRNMNRAAKDISADNSSSLVDALRKKKDDLLEMINDLSQKRNEYQMKLDSNNSKLELLIQMYSSRGGIAAEKRELTIQKKSECSSELNMLNNRLIDIAGSQLPLCLVDDLLAEIKVQAEDEHEDSILKKSLVQLEELHREFKNTNIESAAASAAFLEFVKSTAESNNVDQVYGISDYALFQLGTLVESSIDDSVNDVKSTLKRKNVLEKQIGEYDSYLNLDIDSQELEDINNEIRNIEACIINDQTEINTLNSQIAEVENELRNVTSEFNKELEAFLANAENQDEAVRITKRSEMIVQVIEKYLVALQKRKADLLGSTITECYKKLASKRNLIARVAVEPETLEYHYFTSEGEVVPKDSLSAGEKQIMILAILWSLAICSKQKLPVIIDTPLSRLDSHHRKSIIKKYFPNASQQTIILSTDSEVDQKYYEMMKSDIGDEYTLVYDETTKSTSIKKGYNLGT